MIHKPSCAYTLYEHVGPCTTREGSVIRDDLTPEAILMLQQKHMSDAERKERPLARGVLDYFPDALLEIANVSRIGNDQHNPGQPMHWSKGKSTDHADSIMRHLIDRGKNDIDGTRHSAKIAWRALALLQTELEEERQKRTMIPVETAPAIVECNHRPPCTSPVQCLALTRGQ